MGRKKVIHKAIVYQKMKDGRLIPLFKRHKIFLWSEDTGVLSDGRPVRLENGKWIYEPI